MENQYELPVWKHPRDYGGFSPDGDFYIYSRHRDSSILESLNYEVIFEELKKEAEKYPDPEEDLDAETGMTWVYDFRANHWAVGWIEHLLVRKDAPESVQKLAYELLGALENYPVLDEERYSAELYEATIECWKQMGLRERIEYLSKFRYSIFGARRDDDIPNEVFDRIQMEIEM